MPSSVQFLFVFFLFSLNYQYAIGLNQNQKIFYKPSEEHGIICGVLDKSCHDKYYCMLSNCTDVKDYVFFKENNTFNSSFCIDQTKSRPSTCFDKYIPPRCRIFSDRKHELERFSNSTKKDSLSLKKDLHSMISSNFILPNLLTSVVPNEATNKSNLSSWWSSDCYSNEYWFEDHCYFLGKEVEFSDLEDKDFDTVFSSVNELCKRQHPEALPLAVETEDENEFLKTMIKSLETTQTSIEELIIVTSGVKFLNSSGKWLVWGSKVNDTIIKPIQNPSHATSKAYCFRPRINQWVLLPLPSKTQKNHIVVRPICERLFNPKNISRPLFIKCIQKYRNSNCYDENNQKTFCCAKDDKGYLWFGCPKEMSEEKFGNGIECSWKCNTDGYFAHQYPQCKGPNECRGRYMNNKYSAPEKAYAVSTCPKELYGESSWYCSSKRVFVSLPNYRLCCHNNTFCKETDQFLNFWMGCPSQNVVKKLKCPEDSPVPEALVEWKCLIHGTFNGTPDFSSCYNHENKCEKIDKYNRYWVGSPGKTEQKNCPLLYIGFCYWECNFNGNFEGPEPDCTQCRPQWVDEVAEQIKNETHHEKVMEIMENHTRNQDLRIGFSHVLNLTLDCVNLFKKQNSDCEISVFKKFLTQYSNILKNIAGNPNVWSSFSVSERREYGIKVIETTQVATFAYLENMDPKKVFSDFVYHATLASLDCDGYDFFVSYSPSMKGAKFPLEGVKKSFWQLKITEIKESDVLFAAMGLVMNSSLSSLMFPKGPGLIGMELNSPVVSFSVKTSKNGEAVEAADTVFDITFKHINRTRLPETQIIRRRLHEGETPSGMFNSTMCYYYVNSDWSSQQCQLIYTSRDETVCSCVLQLTPSVGLLMSIHKYIPDTILEMISLITSGISIICLILALVVFHTFKTTKNERVLIGSNLCFCLLVGHILLITVMDKRFFNISDSLCSGYAFLLHYVFMAAFSWMFVEGCHLYRMLVLVFNSNIKYRCTYILIGYGIPLVVVGVTSLIGFILDEQPYGQDELCWLHIPDYVWAFIGPVVLATSVNFVILIITMKLAVSSKIKTEKSSLGNLKLWVKGWISLSTLLGITWLFGLSLLQYNKILTYIFVVLNGLQGMFIFLFRCVFSDQYKSAFMLKLKALFPDSELSSSQTNNKIKSGTKLFAITQSSTKLSSRGDNKYLKPENAILTRLDNQINIQKDILKTLNKLSNVGIHSEKAFEIDVDIGIKVLESRTEEPHCDKYKIKKFFNNKKFTKKKETMGNQNFLTDTDSANFPELSYHMNHLTLNNKVGEILVMYHDHDHDHDHDHHHHYHHKKRSVIEIGVKDFFLLV